MILLLAMALSTSAELEALDRAVESCSREIVNPVFAAESRRRSAFMSAVFREQEEIVAGRLDISNRRRALREGGEAAKGDSEAGLALTALALEDRQRALNDRRMLESLRREAVDSKRHFYLSHCDSTRDRK